MKQTIVSGRLPARQRRQRQRDQPDDDRHNRRASGDPWCDRNSSPRTTGRRAPARRQNDQPGDGVELERIPLLENARQEKLHAVVRGRAAKIRRRQQQDLRILETPPASVIRRPPARCAFSISSCSFQRLPFLRRQPFRIARTVREHEQTRRRQARRPGCPRKM